MKIQSKILKQMGFSYRQLRNGGVCYSAPSESIDSTVRGDIFAGFNLKVVSGKSYFFSHDNIDSHTDILNRLEEHYTKVLADANAESAALSGSGSKGRLSSGEQQNIDDNGIFESDILRDNGIDNIRVKHATSGWFIIARSHTTMAYRDFAVAMSAFAARNEDGRLLSVYFSSREEAAAKAKEVFEWLENYYGGHGQNDNAQLLDRLGAAGFYCTCFVSAEKLISITVGVEGEVCPEIYQAMASAGFASQDSPEGEYFKLSWQEPSQSGYKVTAAYNKVLRQLCEMLDSDILKENDSDNILVKDGRGGYIISDATRASLENCCGGNGQEDMTEVTQKRIDAATPPGVGGTELGNIAYEKLLAASIRCNYMSTPGTCRYIINIECDGDHADMARKLMCDGFSLLPGFAGASGVARQTSLYIDCAPVDAREAKAKLDEVCEKVYALLTPILEGNEPLADPLDVIMDACMPGLNHIMQLQTRLSDEYGVSYRRARLHDVPVMLAAFSNPVYKGVAISAGFEFIDIANYGAGELQALLYCLEGEKRRLGRIKGAGVDLTVRGDDTMIAELSDDSCKADDETEDDRKIKWEEIRPVNNPVEAVDPVMPALALEPYEAAKGKPWLGWV
jgi:hypothetical protein